MINEIKLRELFEDRFKIQVPYPYHFPSGLKTKFFEWFKFGFEAAYPPLLTFKTPNPLTPEIRQLKDVRSCSTLIVEPDSKLIFVYSWRSVQQRTMIILADSIEEADEIFKSEEPNISPYVTQLFVDGSESTIIYNN